MKHLITNSMPNRPLPITIISWLFIAAGIVGLAYHATELNMQAPFANDTVPVLLVRLLAVVGGIFTLRGANWGRWLLVAWIAFHVYLSFFHTFTELTMHALLLAVVTYFFFRPKAAAYFKRLHNSN